MAEPSAATTTSTVLRATEAFPSTSVRRHEMGEEDWVAARLTLGEGEVLIWVPSSKALNLSGALDKLAAEIRAAVTT